jgi:ribose transport system substrate-binding protein
LRKIKLFLIFVEFIWIQYFHKSTDIQEINIMKKYIIFIFLLSFFLSFNCTKDKPTSSKKKIGVALLTRSHQFYKDLEDGLKKTAETCGYDLVIVSAESDLGKQISQIEDLITQKVDALIVCPADSKGIGLGIKKANDAKIPVFTADISSDGGDVICHIASDNKAGGVKAAEYMAKVLDGKGEVAIINNPIVSSVLDRVAGFREAISKYPGIKIVADVTGDGERDKSLKVSTDVLQAHPNLNGFFGINDDSALGALGAVQQYKKDKIVIIGYDATPEARSLILSNTNLKADVVQNPKEIGKIAVEKINDYFNSKQVPKVVPVEVGIVDKESLQKESGK